MGADPRSESRWEHPAFGLSPALPRMVLGPLPTTVTRLGRLVCAGCDTTPPPPAISNVIGFFSFFPPSFACQAAFPSGLEEG